MAAVFDAAAEMGESVIFMDEIDALATSRDAPGGMHEATRRSLSVLLRRLDGFDPNASTILIAATNRPQDWTPPSRRASSSPSASLSRTRARARRSCSSTPRTCRPPTSARSPRRRTAHQVATCATCARLRSGSGRQSACARRARPRGRRCRRRRSTEALSQRRARGLLGAGGTAAQGPMNLA